MSLGCEPRRQRARDAALRRLRVTIVGVTAGAVGLAGVFSAIAAQAFRGHARPAPTATVRHARAARSSVPGPQAIPAIAGEPAQLSAPQQPPVAESQPPPEPASPQAVSGGS